MHIFILPVVLFSLQPGIESLSRSDFSNSDDFEYAIAALAEAIMSTSDRRSLRTIVKIYGGLQQAAPSFEVPSRDADMVYEASITANGEKYRVARVYISGSETFSGFIGRRETLVWNGMLAWSMGHFPGLGTSLDLANSPSVPHRMCGAMVASGRWLFARPARINLREIISHIHPEVRCQGDQNIACWRFEINEEHEPDITQLVQISYQPSKGDFHGASLHIDLRWFRRSTETAGQEEIDWDNPRAMSRVAYHDCRTGVPARVTQFVWHAPTAGRDEGLEGVTEIEILGTFPPNDADGFSWLPEFEAGVTVSDSRYELGYIIGTTKLNIAGRLFVTEIPLEGDVGANLARWVSCGTFADLVE